MMNEAVDEQAVANEQPAALPLSGRVLGPGDLAGTLGADFFLPRDMLMRVQAYACQTASLPVDAQKLREALAQPIEEPAEGEAEGEDTSLWAKAPEKAKKLDELGDLFESMGEHTGHWTREVLPGVVQTAHLVSQYALRCDPVYRTLIDTARELQTKPNDAMLQGRLDRLMDRLAKEAASCSKATEAVQSQLGELLKMARQDAQDLERIEGDLKALAVAEADADDPTVLEGFSEVDKIEKKLQAAEDSLAAANARHAKDMALFTGMSVGTGIFGVLTVLTLPYTMLIVPVVVTTGTGVTAAIAGADAAKALADIERASKDIANLKRSHATALMLKTALRIAQRGAGELTLGGEAVLEAMERSTKQWRQLDRDIARLRDSTRDHPEQLPMLFRVQEIEAARAAWQALRTAADDFRVHAYIRVLPIGDEDDALTRLEEGSLELKESASEEQAPG